MTLTPEEQKDLARILALVSNYEASKRRYDANRSLNAADNLDYAVRALENSVPEMCRVMRSLTTQNEALEREVERLRGHLTGMLGYCMEADAPSINTLQGKIQAALTEEKADGR